MSENEVNSYKDVVSEKISDIKISKVNTYGLRSLCYEINNQKKGYYLFIEVILLSTRELQKMEKF